MKYVVKCPAKKGNYNEAARALAEMRAARRELNAERRKLRCASL